jgi:hypothetical protein
LKSAYKLGISMTDNSLDSLRRVATTKQSKIIRFRSKNTPNLSEFDAFAGELMADGRNGNRVMRLPKVRIVEDSYFAR